ncbi:flagellar biosynthetic protein FliO [Methylophaga sp. 41_12_T18]|nr:flagellar biosynthetic protein FliO [Methylophaga sp. 41_12_T18]
MSLAAVSSDGDTVVAKTLTSPPLSTSALVETLLGLFLVLGLIMFLAWLIKRTNRFQATANGEMKIIAGLALGPKERAVLLQVGEQQILVGVTAQQIQTLHVLDKPISLDNSSEKPIVFADKLQQLIQQRGKS